MPDKGKLIVISGPSGVGKSTICRAVVSRTGASRIVTMTTRPQSPGETDGVDYHFVTRDQFRHAIESGQLLEHAEVFGHLYGSPKASVIDAINRGRSVVVVLDVQGGLQVKRDNPDAVLIFILPPDTRLLKERLTTRGRDSSSDMETRLKCSAEEMATAERYYDKMVVNDNLELAIEQVAAIVMS